MTIHEKVLTTVSLEFSAIARQMSMSGKKMISLGLGEPGFATPREVIDASHSSMLSGETRYSSPWGISDLLDKLRVKIYKDSGIEPKANELIVTYGAKQALSLLLTSILVPEDEVIVLSPCFVSYIPQIYLAEPKAKVVEFSLCKTDFSLDFDKLKKVINKQTKAIILNYPNNPTGYIPLPIEIEKIVELCKTNNVKIISDEVYSSMVLPNNSFTTLASYRDYYNEIYVIDGFSKAYSMTGWRIGYLSGNSEIISKVSKLQQHLNTNIPVFIQRGAIAALDLDESHMLSYIKQLSVNELKLYNTLKNIKSLKYVRTNGGMFSFINISATGLTSDEFCTKFLNNYSVACTPGIIFGNDWDDHIRISLGGDINEFDVSMLRLASFVRSINEINN